MTIEEIMRTIETPIKSLREMMNEVVDKINDTTTKNWMKYFIEEKGHVIRPTLVFLTYFSFNEAPNELELKNLKKMALAFEFLHTASLIHDDVLDETEIRRGKKTINKQIGSRGAILVGNVFYLEAFRIASELPSLSYFKSMIDTSENMCFGEVLQLENQNKILKLEEYMDIIQKKTAMLIAMSCREGARLAGASEEMVKVLEKIGMYFGILYQLRDDIKDEDVKVDSKVNIVDLIDECSDKFAIELKKVSLGTIYGEALISFGKLMM